MNVVNEAYATNGHVNRIAGINAAEVVLYPRLEARFVVATRELVDSLLHVNEKNRGVRASHAAKLRETVLKGQWKVTNQGIGVDKHGVLLDGQHRLMALRDAKYPPVTVLLVTGLEPDAIAGIDIGAKRDYYDVVKLLWDEGVRKTAVSSTKTLANMRWREDAWREVKHEYGISPEDGIRWLKAYGSGIKLLLESMKKESMFRAGVRAACVVLSQTFPDIAPQFIRAVEFGEELRLGMPAYQLRQALLQHGGERKKLRTEHDFAIAVRCINSEIQGTSIRVWKSTMQADWCREIKERMPRIDLHEGQVV